MIQRDGHTTFHTTIQRAAGTPKCIPFIGEFHAGCYGFASTSNGIEGWMHPDQRTSCMISIISAGLKLALVRLSCVPIVPIVHVDTKST